MASASRLAPATEGARHSLDLLQPQRPRRSGEPGSRLRATRNLLADFTAFAGARRLAAAAALILAGAMLEGAGILLVVPLLQPGALDNLAEVAILAPFGGSAQIALIFAAFALLIAARGALLVYRDTHLATLQQGYVDATKRRLFGLLAAASWKHVVEVDRARLLKALGGDMVQIGFATHFALQAAVGVLLLAAYCGFAFVLAPQLALLTFTLLAGVALVGALSSRRAGGFGEALVRHDLQMSESSSRFLSGLKLAKAQGLEAGFVGSYETASQASVRNRIAFVRLVSVNRQAAAMLGVLAAAAAVTVAYQTSDLAPATLIAFIVLLSRTAAPSVQVQQGVQQIAHSLPTFDEIDDLARQLAAAAPETPALPYAVPEPVSYGPISLAGVSLAQAERDGAPRARLEAIDLEIAPGELVGLSGDTGAGKTTLLDVIAGLAHPDEGRVAVAGRDIAVAEHQARLAYLAAEPALFGGTVRDNLAWVVPHADDRRIWAALETADADGLVRGLGDGLDSRLDEGGANLSAGERQLIAFARALMRRPSLILIDEATASLDADREARLLARLTALEPRPTILLVSHRAASLARCDRVIAFADGAIVAEHAPSEWRRLHGLQSGASCR